MGNIVSVTEVLRCLGIPSQVVTNYYSAHDNDGNPKTDIILDENGRIDRNRTRDSIWNYHCWNECYMSRPDLPAGFGGWQVVDATPQETSDGMYRCGPASVQAIKHGQICFPFDAAFVFAEINSDVVFYSRSKDGTMAPVKVNRTHVGRLVLTKSPGNVTRRDITDQYKFSEDVRELVVVESKSYMKRLVEQANLHFIVTGKIRETGQIITAMKVVTLQNPKLIVRVSSGGKVNEEMIVSVEFTNPFSFSLEGVYIRMEGPGMMTPKSQYYSLITGGSSLTWTEYFTPERAGTSRVIATLDCPALRQVYGQASVTIKP
ncbi:LOW QUALITY PROTEIN: coagulation factor XIII A chain-like [Archocentrus centrarchus]|uniref:LOW QUALITY PROTEIN: coagulation factor XIII A chain-like n=1 Tax=Archocentrus centrarchus TaxID=63155 RepID=UPI0011E9C702|nr:LOW QUALITY PROTEIN: coagulation factor XIII A chain-like [Archocentrus centrarchus]